MVALISQYDSFLGGILRCLYRAKPLLLKQSEKNLTYAQLFDFSDLEEAKSSVLEKEIDSILRESHHEQFSILQSRFDVVLSQEQPYWPVFVELTQRRNLFVHSAGKVSAQYLKVCDDHKAHKGTRPLIGDQLDVSPEYFQRAHACIFEIGVKLAHVLWRKLLPEQREEADGHLLAVCLDLIVAGEYNLSVILGVFATELKKHHSDDLRRRMVINLSQAYKWAGNAAQAEKVIANEDWSSCGVIFQLAVAVLRDDFAKAADLMKQLATNNGIAKSDYGDWPIFKEFRKSQQFKEAYENTYGHALATREPDMVEKFLTMKLKSKATDPKTPDPSSDAKIPDVMQN